jgi:predicted nucleic acid-binding protein
VTRLYAYVDTSALVKLVVEERETAALEADCASRAALFCSALGATERQRACRRVLTRRQLGRVDEVLEAVFLVEITPAILTAAGLLDPAEARTPDAIHVATALSLGEAELDVITYDVRLAQMAHAHGLEVVRPGAGR